MHCTSIGALTLEMDASLTNTLKQLDAKGVDVASVDAVLQEAKRLYLASDAANSEGDTKTAFALADKAKQTEAIGRTLAKVSPAVLNAPVATQTAVKLVIDPVPPARVLAPNERQPGEVLLPGEKAAASIAAPDSALASLAKWALGGLVVYGVYRAVRKR